MKSNVSQSENRGVVWDGHSWKARITVKKVLYSLGTYPTQEQAQEAYDKAKAEAFSFGKLSSNAYAISNK